MKTEWIVLKQRVSSMPQTECLVDVETDQILGRIQDEFGPEMLYFEDMRPEASNTGKGRRTFYTTAEGVKRHVQQMFEFEASLEAMWNNSPRLEL